MKNLTLEEFTRMTGAGTGSPGGGSVSALAGAMAAALSAMVAGLTAGREKYADVSAQMEDAIPVLERVYEELLDDIRRDSESFDRYMQALALPKTTAQEKEARSRMMQEGLKEAVMVPLGVARKSLSVLPYAKLMAECGNKTAVTDALVGTMMARTAVLGAAANVRINLRSVKDEEFVRRVLQEADRLEQQAQEMEDEIRKRTREQLY